VPDLEIQRAVISADHFVDNEQMQNVARLAMVKPEMELVTQRWKALGGYSAPPQAAEKYKNDLTVLFKKHNCSPGRSMIGVVVQVCYRTNFPTLC